MKFNIRGQKMTVTDPIKKYIETKIGKLNKYFEHPDDLTANVLLRVRGKDQVVEVTIPAPKFILRAEESNEDMYASIDLVVDKLESQMRKNKKRMHDKVNKHKFEDFIADFENIGYEEDTNKIIKRKSIEMKPMSEAEAELQMNLLGHEFFVFKNNSTNEVSVIYKRRDGNFGIIDTK